MRNKNQGQRMKWQRIQQVQKVNSKVTGKEQNQVQTYTPKNSRDFKLFKTSKINRYASQQEFKVGTKNLNVPHNQQSNTKADQKIMNNIKSIASTQHSTVDTQNKSIIKDNEQIRQKPYFGNQNYLKNQKKQTMQKGNPTTYAGRFKIIKKLGVGKFGHVYLVKQLLSGFHLAMKIVQKKQIIKGNILTQFIRQLKIQAYLDHPNIIKLYGFFHDQEYFYVLMELGSDGQLYQIIEHEKILSQETTSYIIKSLLEAIGYMHSFKILHRDIKPQNIVLVHGNVKICDFGWAVNKKEDLRSTFCGTPLYLSPQLLTGNKYDQKVDLWAIGILACELRMGCLPFHIKQKQDLTKIITDEVSYPNQISNPLSKQFKKFIESILQKNPKDRLNSTQLLGLQFIKKYQQLQTCQQLCGKFKFKKSDII